MDDEDFWVKQFDEWRQQEYDHGSADEVSVRMYLEVASDYNNLQAERAKSVRNNSPRGGDSFPAKRWRRSIRVVKDVQSYRRAYGGDNPSALILRMINDFNSFRSVTRGDSSGQRIAREDESIRRKAVRRDRIRQEWEDRCAEFPSIVSLRDARWDADPPMPPPSVAECEAMSDTDAEDARALAEFDARVQNEYEDIFRIDPED